jgi:hypothetical protein
VRLNRLLFVLFAVAALTAGVFIGWDHWSPRKPILVYPALVDLGAREKGEIVVGRFEIGNAGGSTLLIDQIQASCISAGLEWEVNGEFVRLNSIQIAPGERMELVLRTGTGAAIGESQSVQVSFHSNDPEHPEGRIDLFIPCITGGISSHPRAVAFGNVAVGEQVRRVVDLYDARSFGRRIATVQSSHPDRFGVRLIELSEHEDGKDADAGRKLIARLEVTARSEAPQQLEGEVEIRLADQNRLPDRIPVTGVVVSAVKASPTTIVLPRKVGQQTVYSGDVLVQSRDGAPLSVRVLSTPPNLNIEVRTVADHLDRQLVVVKAKSPDGVPELTGKTRIKLGVRAGDLGEESLEIPVLVTKNPQKSK